MGNIFFLLILLLTTDDWMTLLFCSFYVWYYVYFHHTIRILNYKYLKRVFFFFPLHKSWVEFKKIAVTGYIKNTMLVYCLFTDRLSMNTIYWVNLHKPILINDKMLPTSKSFLIVSFGYEWTIFLFLFLNIFSHQYCFWKC